MTSAFANDNLTQRILLNNWQGVRSPYRTILTPTNRSRREGIVPVKKTRARTSKIKKGKIALSFASPDFFFKKFTL